MGDELDSQFFSAVGDFYKAIEVSATEDAERCDVLACSKWLQDNPEALEELPFGIPTSGHIQSEFGPRIHPIRKKPHFHKGIDIATTEGTAVRATAAGVVIFSGNLNNGYGNQVLIKHNNIYITRYAHLFVRFVFEGMEVKEGDVIGLVGETGLATGPHLHYEVIVKGEPKNPHFYFNLFRP